MVQDDGLSVVAESLRRVRRGLAWLAGGFWLAAAIALGIGLAQKKATPMTIGLGGAAAGAGVLTLGFLLHYAKIESVSIYRVLRDTP